MEIDNPKNSFTLFEIGEKLDYLVNLYEQNSLPKVLMLSGEKGIGKFTLINHLMSYIFDKENYDLNKKRINQNSVYYKDYLNDLFFNIIYLSGEDFKKSKIDNIRELKSLILKSNLSNKERFIILDDIELFNLNSINALLKLIEEPKSKDHFIIINNKTKSLIDTISSRALEIKIFLNNKKKINVIESLIKNYEINTLIDFRISNISPGNFFSFNQIAAENEINIEDNFLKNFEKLLILYKKTKNFKIINFILYLTDIYFLKLNLENKQFEKNIDDKRFIINNINNFISFNLNQTSLLNNINDRIANE